MVRLTVFGSSSEGWPAAHWAVDDLFARSNSGRWMSIDGSAQNSSIPLGTWMAPGITPRFRRVGFPHIEAASTEPWPIE
jgi:hypothetical protein